MGARTVHGRWDPARVRPPPPPPVSLRPLPSPRSGVEELERDICFILGLLAIKVDHQAAICDAGALPTLVSMIRRYAGRNDVHLTGVPAQTCRRTSDAITNLAHENNGIKNRVRQEGGIPPLVSLLHSVDPKVQRAVAGSLRTLAFKNDENKNIIVDLGSLPLLIQMLRAEDTTIHYEVRAVGRRCGGLLGPRRASHGWEMGPRCTAGPAARLHPASSPPHPPLLVPRGWPALPAARPWPSPQAVGVIGNLVHSSAVIKKRVLEEGALQPVINLLSSSCTDSQREAALLLGQFATGGPQGATGGQGLAPDLPHRRCLAPLPGASLPSPAPPGSCPCPPCAPPLLPRLQPRATTSTR